MYRIRLNDGTELGARYCSAQNGILTLRILSDDRFIDVAALFSDPERTRTVTFLYGDMLDLCEGYTDLYFLHSPVPGEYVAALRKVSDR